jgi:hypothetical protein
MPPALAGMLAAALKIILADLQMERIEEAEKGETR